MFAVIFSAKIKALDEDYYIAAQRMRALAMEEYGCLEFTSMLEEGVEIAISYWSSKEEIKKWKGNSEHLAVQALGKERWYQNYKVQIVEVLHEYSNGEGGRL